MLVAVHASLLNCRIQRDRPIGKEHSSHEGPEHFDIVASPVRYGCPCNRADSAWDRCSYMVWLNMLRDQERLNPSTERLLEVSDGQRIPMTQPDPTPVPTAEAIPVTAPDPGNMPAPSATPEVLPPERLIIPRISVDWPITPADVDHLPKFRGVGWMFGSAFPGMPGNMVLTGHVGGPYATLTRLHQVQPGDDILV